MKSPAANELKFAMEISKSACPSPLTSPSTVPLAEPELARDTMEGVGANEAKGLISGKRRVGIDGREVDLVQLWR